MERKDKVEGEGSYTGSKDYNERTKKFVEEFPNAIDIVTRGVKTGLPLGDCIKAIASEGQAQGLHVIAGVRLIGDRRVDVERAGLQPEVDGGGEPLPVLEHEEGTGAGQLGEALQDALQQELLLFGRMKDEG